MFDFMWFVLALMKDTCPRLLLLYSDHFLCVSKFICCQIFFDHQESFNIFSHDRFYEKSFTLIDL